MAKGTIVFRTQHAAGTHRTAAKMGEAARRIRGLVLSEMRARSPELHDVFSGHAPYDADERDDYHMRDHITVKIQAAGRIKAEVEVEAISPESGFDYLDVTRYGHRGSITPKKMLWLKWTDGSGTHFAKETAGSHPDADWVEEARPEADAVSAQIADRVGRVVYTRLLA